MQWCSLNVSLMINAYILTIVKEWKNLCWIGYCTEWLYHPILWCFLHLHYNQQAYSVILHFITFNAQTTFSALFLLQFFNEQLACIYIINDDPYPSYWLQLISIQTWHILFLQIVNVIIPSGKGMGNDTYKVEYHYNVIQNYMILHTAL